MKEYERFGTKPTVGREKKLVFTEALTTRFLNPSSGDEEAKRYFEEWLLDRIKGHLRYGDLPLTIVTTIKEATRTDYVGGFVIMDLEEYTRLTSLGEEKK